MADVIRKQAVQLGDQVECPLLGSVMERLRDRSLLAKQMPALEGTQISGERSELASEADLMELIPVLWPAEAANELGRLGDLRLLKLLGHGGMGAVFLAEDMRLKRRVTLKVLRPRFARKNDAAERFLREAQAAATVQHDKVVTIFQVGKDNMMRSLTKRPRGSIDLDSIVFHSWRVRKPSDYDVAHFETLDS